MSDLKERRGHTAKDKTGCEHEGSEWYGQEESVSDKVKFDTVHEQITLRPSGPTVLSLPRDEKSGASFQ